MINDIRAAGARIRLIGDGDLSAGIAAAVMGTGVQAVMAPAARRRCDYRGRDPMLNGYMQGRLVIDKPELEERIAEMGIKDKKRITRPKTWLPASS